MKTLLDFLYEADALEINGVFCRYFFIESEEIENDDDIILHLDFNADLVQYEYFFTKKDLEEATLTRDGVTWVVGKERDYVTAYNVSAMR